MEKSRMQEKLVGLYLRLNGFFQTGLIVHSEVKGRNRTELDRIAVRFPNHRQEDRQVDLCTKLGSKGSVIELLIVEVKNTKLVFNDVLHDKSKNAEANWYKILSWAGLLPKDEIERVTSLLIESLINGKAGQFETVVAENAAMAIQIKPLLICVEGSGEYIESGGITGQDIIDYIWMCLCPQVPRGTCSEKYDLKLWGDEFEHLITFFKGSEAKPTLSAFYTHFNIS